MPFSVTSSGFREQNAPNNLPTSFDCSGSPYVPGMPLPTCHSCQTVSCVFGTIIDPGDSSPEHPRPCICACQSPHVPNATNTGCICNTTCGEGEVLDSDTCTCKICNGPMEVVGLNCQCRHELVEACSLQPDHHFDEHSCNCIPTDHGCSNHCHGNQILDAQCNCGCPVGMHLSGDDCVCNDGMIQSGAGCYCPLCYTHDSTGCHAPVTPPHICYGGTVLTADCQDCLCPPGSCEIRSDDGVNLIGCSRCEE